MCLFFVVRERGLGGGKTWLTKTYRVFWGYKYSWDAAPSGAVSTASVLLLLSAALDPFVLVESYGPHKVRDRLSSAASAFFFIGGRVMLLFVFKASKPYSYSEITYSTSLRRPPCHPRTWRLFSHYVIVCCYHFSTGMWTLIKARKTAAREHDADTLLRRRVC